MRPGDPLVIAGHPFKLEAFQDGGETIFIRIEPGPGFDEAKAWLEDRHAEGQWFLLESPFRATEAKVTAVRMGERGFRARLELRTTGDALYLLPPQ